MFIKVKPILIGTCLLSFIVLATPALALDCSKSWLAKTGIIPGGCIIPATCLEGTTVGACGLTQVFQTIVNVSQVLLALTGSAALLMIMYGGILWIISAGNQEQIQKGKAAIVAAAIGIAVILGAWLIVNFTILALTKGEVGGTATIFQGQAWSQEQQTESSTQSKKGGTLEDVGNWIRGLRGL